MRKAIGFITALALVFVISCNNKPIEPFELSVADYNYSLAYSVLYTLTDKNLTITFRGELENEKDSVLYTSTDLPKNEIRKLADINIDSLNVLYSNACIEDGDIKTISFNKNGVNKTIHLENYYHTELSPAIEIINGLVPEKYKMDFDKEGLISEMENCGKFKIIKNWEK